MLKLTFTREPFLLDLVPGVRVHVRPATTLVFTAAGESMAWTPVDGLPSESVIRVAFVKAVAKAAILAWEGIGDADGEPLAPSPEAIDRRAYRAPGPIATRCPRPCRGAGRG